MKIYTKGNLFLLFFSVCSVAGFAQTEAQRAKIARSYDQNVLSQLKQQFSDEYTANHARALEMAKIKGLPITKVIKGGRVAELQGVDPNGNLLYYATDNAESAITSRANTLYPGGALNLNLTGNGMSAGVWDQYLAYADHVDLTGRVFNSDGTNVGHGDHGTHVTGTIMSSGAHSGTGMPGRGIAYEASVLNNDWNNDLGEMTDAALNSGMLLSNHSYGTVASTDPSFQYYFGAYIGASKSIDDLLYNAPYYQPCVAAGNDRDGNFNTAKGGHDLLTKWCTSKNPICVAAVYAVPNYTGASSVVMSDFSNWGPTDDNRIKPDISDKGVNVYSTVDYSKTSYTIMSGTSMATPGVTGTLLLLQQHYNNTYYPDPNAPAPPQPYMKAATLKGLMCHTADEAGSDPGPDTKFGWGLINAEKAAETITQSVSGQSIIAELDLLQGQTYTKTITVATGEPLMATIAWTDKGGQPNNGVVDLATPVLVNDLDIRLTKVGGDTYFPWKLDDMSNGLDAPAIKGDNIVDNIEKVEIPQASGDYVLTVAHKGNLVDGHQNFSLIVTGTNLVLATEKNDFKVFNVWPNPAKDVLNVSLQSDSFDDANATLYDVQGRVVLNKKLNTSSDYMNGVLDLTTLNKGVYLLRINQGGKEATKKIMIN